jgi:FK506-binding protein 1
MEVEQKIDQKVADVAPLDESKIDQKVSQQDDDRPQAFSSSSSSPTTSPVDDDAVATNPEEILRIQQAARMIYEKVYDESVGRYYYFNAREQTSTWELPSEFNGDDSFLLTPRSRELMVLKMDAGTWKTSSSMTKDEAARTIQGLYRRRQSRKLIVQAIQSMYEKIYDEQSGMFFYFNKQTQQSIWTKPPLLGYWDDVPLTPRSKELQEAGQIPGDAGEVGASSAIPPSTGTATIDEGKGPEVDETYSNQDYTSYNSNNSAQQPQQQQQQQQQSMNYSISSDEGGSFNDEYKSNNTFNESKFSSSNQSGEMEFKMDSNMLLRQLQDFLIDNELDDYEEALIEDGFDDMEALLAILESDIDAIGFTLADKRILMNAIDKFRATADLDYDVSGSDSDEEKLDDDDLDSIGSGDAEDAEDRLRRMREDGDEYSISDGGYPDGDVDLEGVEIKILFEGDDENFAEPGQIIRMHYKAYIKGSSNSFEDSRLRGRVFEFKLDAAQVVPGLDEAMRTLSWGTKASITLEPHVAYGESGHPPVIPPNSHLIFEVQFIKSYYAEKSIDDGYIER